MQAANLLVVEKSTILEPDVLQQIAPALNMKQVKHIVSLYSPDK